MSRFKYTCPLCGHGFDTTGEKCRSCPVGSNCNLVCCPNCGYGFAEESRLLSWLRALGSRLRIPGFE